MNKKSILLIGGVLILSSAMFFSCSGDKNEAAANDKDSLSSFSTEKSTYVASGGPESKIRPLDSLHLPPNPEVLKSMEVDLSQDLSAKSMQELRILRNAVYANKGYLFEEADVRAWFSFSSPWYDTLAESVYYKGNEENKVTLSSAEMAFVEKVKKREAELKAGNYIYNNGVKLANVANIVNLFQYKDLSPELMQMLDKNNFAIVPADNIQLFHTYEQNDYHQVPNFITSDLFLQLYHMYFTYLLRSLEEEKFYTSISQLTDEMEKKCAAYAASTSDPKLKEIAQFNQVFYAVPYYILTGKKKAIPAQYKEKFDAELRNLNDLNDVPSPVLGVSPPAFNYSLFKPRGHYSRTEKLKKYFKAMMWLQTAPFCMDQETQIKNFSFTAFMMQDGKTSGGKPFTELYNNVYEPICFIIGQPDNLSLNDVVDFIHQNKITGIENLTQPAVQSSLKKYLTETAKKKDRIKNDLAPTCGEKINFMPQRYLPDNEILQGMADLKPNCERPFPKGMDVLAAFGAKSAEKILYEHEKDQEKWNKFSDNLDKLKNKFKDFPEWNSTVYNKWTQTLVNMQDTLKEYPAFMKTSAWEKKNLNTALASWAELKHDAILYAEQPMAAECGSGGPPPPYTVGYVEPNLVFWNRMNELIDLTASMLGKHKLFTEDIKEKSDKIKENCAFLLSAVKKELKGQRLTRQEFETIEVIGSTYEYLTLSIVEPGKYLDSWENVQGPDKSVAVVADVYTRNILGDKKSGVLHEAAGNVNDLYVVVQIGDYLYLTKGAVFSYYEFVQPVGTRLTDEEWQKMIEDKKLPPLPSWIKDVMYFGKGKAPKADERIFYSSGC